MPTRRRPVMNAYTIPSPYTITTITVSATYGAIELASPSNDSAPSKASAGAGRRRTDRGLLALGALVLFTGLVSVGNAQVATLDADALTILKDINGIQNAANGFLNTINGFQSKISSAIGLSGQNEIMGLLGSVKPAQTAALSNYNGPASMQTAFSSLAAPNQTFLNSNVGAPPNFSSPQSAATWFQKLNYQAPAANASPQTIAQQMATRANIAANIHVQSQALASNTLSKAPNQTSLNTS